MTKTGKVQKCQVFSDSLSVLSALENPSNAITLKLKNIILESKNAGKEIELIWIPAHVGINGNEQADSLAKIATREGKLMNTTIPHIDLVAKFKRDVIFGNNSKLKLQGESKGKKFFKIFYNEKCKEPWFHKFDHFEISRRAIVSINRIRSSHTSLNHSLARFGIVESDL
ncbi:hypothetical protein TKK_0017296 [Trichogramma kaykai]